MERDKKVNKELEDLGWTVIRFWERHEVLKERNKWVKEIRKVVDSKKVENKVEIKKKILEKEILYKELNLLLINVLS